MTRKGTKMANRTKLTPAKLEKFLQALSSTGNVSRAAQSIGISRKHMYSLRESNEEFASAWDEAIASGVDDLEEEARRRAYLGTEKPVYQQGKCVGTVREYSDTLLIFLLKAHRPDKYKERISQDINAKFDIAEEIKAARQRVVRE